MKPEHIIGLEDRGLSSVPLKQIATYSSDPEAASLYRNGGKRAMDLAITLLLGLVILPVVGLLALLVMLDGHNPFYAQERVGRGGRIYRMWKLRSMVPGADAALEAHLAADPALRAEWDVHQKLTNDPRITGLGRLLRAYSLDELPQFLNVITGDMSVVGPRPMMPGQRHLYSGKSYFELRPGITGPWQVKDRHASSFAERARYDEAYNRTMSWLGDLRLVGCTIGVILRGRGC